MGLRSPQEMQLVRTRPEGSQRFQAGQAPQISGKFLDTIQRSNEAQEKERLRREQENKDFLKVKYQNEAEEVVNHAKSAVALTQGSDTLSEVTKQRDFIRRGIDERLAKIPAKYQQEFATLTQQFVNKFDRTALPYQVSQIQSMRKQAYDDRLANETNEAIEGSGDSLWFTEFAMPRVEDRARQIALMKYGQDLGAEVTPGVTVGDMVDTYAQNARSAVVLGAIRQQAAAGSVSKALETLQMHTEGMTEGDRLKAFKTIDAATENGNTRFASELLTQGLQFNSEDALAREEFYRQNAPNDKVFRQVTLMDRSRLALVDRQEQEQLKKLTASINDKVTKGQAPTTEELLQVPGDKRAKVLNDIATLAAGTPVPTNWATYDTWANLLERDPEKFADTFSKSALRGDLNEKELNTLSRAQSRIVDSRRVEAKRLRNAKPDNVVGDITRQFQLQRDIYDPQQIGTLRNAVQERYEDLLEAEPNISREDLRKRIKKDIYQYGLQEIDVPGRFWGTNKALKVPETLDPVPHPDVIEYWKKKRPGITEEQLKQAAKAAVGAGVDITRPLK